MQHAVTPIHDLLTTSVAAKVIDRTPAAIRALTARGRLRPAITLEGGQRLYARADIEALRDARRQRERSRVDPD